MIEIDSRGALTLTTAHDLLPELGIERPTKASEDNKRVSPLDDGVSLGD